MIDVFQIVVTTRHDSLRFVADLSLTLKPAYTRGINFNAPQSPIRNPQSYQFFKELIHLGFIKIFIKLIAALQHWGIAARAQTFRLDQREAVVRCRLADFDIQFVLEMIHNFVGVAKHA